MPSGSVAGSSSSAWNWASASSLSFAIAASTSCLGDLGELLARAAARRRRVRHPDEVAVVAGRHDPDLARIDVAVGTGLGGRDRHLARRAPDADVGRAARDARRPAGTPPRRARTRCRSASRRPIPLGIVYADDGSQFVNRTPPVAFSRTTFLPVAGNSPLTVTGTWTVVAGMTPASGSTVVAAGSAVTENSIGPIVSIRGVTVMSAVGRTVTAATAPAPRSRSRTTPTATARPLTPRRGRSVRTPRLDDDRLRVRRCRRDARRAVVVRRGLGDRLRRRAAWGRCRATGRSAARRRRAGSQVAAAAAAAAAPRPTVRRSIVGSLGVVDRVERRLVLPHRAEHGEPGRGRERPGRLVGRDDVQPPAGDQRLAGEQPEVDARRRDPRPERQHEPHPSVVRGPDAGGGGRDLVVGVEVDDGGHGCPNPRP